MHDQLQIQIVSTANNKLDIINERNTNTSTITILIKFKTGLAREQCLLMRKLCTSSSAWAEKLAEIIKASIENVPHVLSSPLLSSLLTQSSYTQLSVERSSLNLLFGIVLFLGETVDKNFLYTGCKATYSGSVSGMVEECIVLGFQKVSKELQNLDEWKGWVICLCTSHYIFYVDYPMVYLFYV